MADMQSEFVGFGAPTQNWSKLPHALINELSNIDSVSELKVILYILRHTWGYHDTEKRITNDEFCNGRKRGDGTRIDNGCGLSPKSVRAGIANAVEHGYITVEIDSRDLARQKHYYAINSGGEKVTPRGGESNPQGGESNPRTEKDTLSKETLSENTLGNRPPPAEKAEEAAILEKQRSEGVALPHPGIEEPWWKMKARAYKLCPEFEPAIHGELYRALQKATGKEALIASGGELSDRAAAEVQRATVALWGMNFQTVESLRDLYRAYRKAHPKTTLPRPDWLSEYASRYIEEQEQKQNGNNNPLGGLPGATTGSNGAGTGGSTLPALDPEIAARFQRRREQRAAAAGD